MKHTQLRIPESIHSWIIQRAKNNDRSMNAEINRILKEKRQEEKNQKQAA